MIIRHCEKHGMEWNGLEWNGMEHVLILLLRDEYIRTYAWTCVLCTDTV